MPDDSYVVVEIVFKFVGGLAQRHALQNAKHEIVQKVTRAV
jgi:hypothetical protein